MATMRTYEKTHPWISFSIDLSDAPARLWMALGEAQSKCEHVAGVPLRPDTAYELHKIYLAKGVLATTAIEGNTLSEEEVLQLVHDKLELPPSREYQKKEIQNVIAAFNEMLSLIGKGTEIPVSPEMIMRTNALVLKDLEKGEDVIPGKVRKDSRIVGRYLCAPAEDCEYLLATFCNWMNGPTFESGRSGEEIVNGIIKSIAAHIYFVWIHPFGDGNGRTARLLEHKFLIESGVPSDAAHLLSNHYNLTRAEYYRQLDAASKSGGNILPFIEYAVQGFVDQLKEQVTVIREQQMDIAWINYIHDRFRGDKSESGRRRRALVLAMSRYNVPLQKGVMPKLTTELAAGYALKTPKTVSRDLNALLDMELIDQSPEGYMAAKDKILAFLPLRTHAIQPRRQKSKATGTRNGTIRRSRDGQLLLF
jgi:Fic family protein